MSFLIAALLAMGITVMLIPPLTAIAPKLGVIDVPGGRKAHAAPIPRIGGIAMAAGMLLAMLLMGEFSRPMRGLLVGLMVLLPFGIQDDRVTLSPSIKLLGQVVAALCVMIIGDVQINTLRHVESVLLPVWLAWPLTLAFIVGVTNAINLADGLDGLAGGTTLLCLSGLLVLALAVDNLQVVFVCVVSMAALVGFLRYNTHPANIFMGDAGSQILGFSAAVVSLMLTQCQDQPLSPAVPLLLLGVPVIDTLSVMTERMLSGRSPFEADRTHVHHRLLAFGFAHHEAVIVIYALQAVMVVLAWCLRFDSDWLIMSVFGMVACSIVTLLRVGRARHWQWRSRHERKVAWFSRVVRRFHDPDTAAKLTEAAGNVLGLGVVGYVLLVLINGNEVSVSWDMRLLSASTAILLLIGMILGRRQAMTGWLERSTLYIGVLMAVVLEHQSAKLQTTLWHLEIGLFAILLGALVIRHYFNVQRRMVISPLDVLVVLLALVLPNLSGSQLGPYFTTAVLLKALLLMYGIESLMQSAGFSRHVLAGGTFVFLTAIALGASA